MKRAMLKPVPKPDIVETFDCEQRSPEWFALRRGILTASNMDVLMAEGRDGGPSLTRARLLDQMAAEIISEIPAETYSSAAMKRGLEQEPALIDDYAFERGVTVERVGFVRRTIANPLGEDLVIGCSPDGLVGSSKVLQIKSLQPDLLVRLIDSGRFPSEHKWQCHGELLVTGRASCDLRIGYVGMPIAATYRIQRDESIVAQMRNEAEKFAYELRKLVERVKQKGRLGTAA